MFGTKPWGNPMYEVVIARDGDEGAFYVEKSDIIGLHVEAQTLEEMIAIIEDVAPELIAANHRPARSVFHAFWTAFNARPDAEPAIRFNFTRPVHIASAAA